MQTQPINEKVPAALTDSISRDGRINKYAELIVFGRWLIIEGMPGCPKRRGKPIDPRAMLKVVACALGAQQANDYKSKIAGKMVANSVFHVTSKRLVEQRQRLFGEQSSTREFTSSLRSLTYILPEYLAHIKAGGVNWHGTVVRSSARLEQLNIALLKPSASPVNQASHAMIPVIAADVAPASLPSSFNIDLCYSSPDQESRYRTISAPIPPLPVMSYAIAPIQKSLKAGTIRSDRSDRLVFTPEFDVRKQVRVRALIDRMVITLRSLRAIAAIALHKEIAKKTGATVFVHDRSPACLPLDGLESRINPWVGQLPELPSFTPKGEHFAIQVQDPDPQVLRAVIHAITTCVGIDRPVRPFLLELAVDFYPKGANSPEELLVGREKIVALLQRHHWASHHQLLDTSATKPKRGDARQVYTNKVGKSETRHLFANNSGLKLSDCQINIPEVRNHILLSGKGNDLYLNGHIYRGTRAGEIQTNVQHKIADHRNENKGTSVPLPIKERRGRVECTLTGFEALEAAGIKNVSDLADVSYKAVAKQLIRFRLPTSAATSEDTTETITQMTHRGVYGVELNRRATYLAKREGLSPKPRNNDREGLSLSDWPEMNKAVGDALGRLRTQWKKL